MNTHDQIASCGYESVDVNVSVVQSIPPSGRRGDATKDFGTSSARKSKGGAVDSQRRHARRERPANGEPWDDSARRGACLVGFAAAVGARLYTGPMVR